MISAKYRKRNNREMVDITGLGNTEYSITMGTAYALSAFLLVALKEYEDALEEERELKAVGL